MVRKKFIKSVAKKEQPMTKKNIILAIATFLIGFGATFYIIKTYFPKQKAEQVNRLSK